MAQAGGPTVAQAAALAILPPPRIVGISRTNALFNGASRFGYNDATQTLDNFYVCLNWLRKIPLFPAIEDGSGWRPHVCDLDALEDELFALVLRCRVGWIQITLYDLVPTMLFHFDRKVFLACFADTTTQFTWSSVRKPNPGAPYWTPTVMYRFRREGNVVTIEKDSTLDDNLLRTLKIELLILENKQWKPQFVVQEQRGIVPTSFTSTDPRMIENFTGTLGEEMTRGRAMRRSDLVAIDWHTTPDYVFPNPLPDWVTMDYEKLR